MKKNYKLKFLSESVLLEERGLPVMNTMIIVSITAFIALFLVWANLVTIEDSVDVSGLVIISDSGERSILGYATTDTINLISQGELVYVDIPGVTGRKSISGSVMSTQIEPIYDSNNTAYYEIAVSLELNEGSENDLSGDLLNGMESQLRVVTGTRSLLQYFLGSLYDTGLDVFNN